MVELDPEDGLGDGADVADGLLRRLARVGEDVDLDRATQPVSHHPDGMDTAQSAQLVLELSAAPRRRLDPHRPTNRRSTTHSAWRPCHSPRTRSPRPGTAYGHPTTQRGGLRCRYWTSRA